MIVDTKKNIVHPKFVQMIVKKNTYDNEKQPWWSCDVYNIKGGCYYHT